MAIVFISPREKQKLFILGIAGFFLVAIVTISLIVLFAKPKNIQTEEVFHAPKIRINFDILKSARVQNLQLLPGIEKQYTYEAQDSSKKPQTGKITAMSIDGAQQLLTGLGFTQIVLKEAVAGRDNPFVPYYEIKPPAPVKSPIKKTTKK